MLLYVETQDGEEFCLADVVMVGQLEGSYGREYYNVHLSGGQHVTIKVSHKSRDLLVSEWKISKG